MIFISSHKTYPSPVLKKTKNKLQFINWYLFKNVTGKRHY